MKRKTERREKKRETTLVSIPGVAGTKEARLTGRNHVHEESSRLEGLGEPPHSSLHDLHEGITLLLDGITVSHHQNDGARCPEGSQISDNVGIVAKRAHDQKMKGGLP